jgi:hypothetical protein
VTPFSRGRYAPRNPRWRRLWAGVRIGHLRPEARVIRGIAMLDGAEVVVDAGMLKAV